MMKSFFITAILIVLASTCYAQIDNTWDKWSWLIGKWEGEGSGQPGQGGGVFSFSFDLNEKIIVRKSHSEYPAANNKPSIVHDDLMIVYFGITSNPSKAIYFDNEGHVINYRISYKEKSIVFTSDKSSNVPVFRLTYTLLENNIVDTKFEMSQDGEKFMTYIEGKSKKVL